MIIMIPVCEACGKECTPVTADHGIGAYEYWGARGVDRRIATLSDCCDGDIVEMDEADYANKEEPKAQPKAFEIDWGFVKPCVKVGNVYRDAHCGDLVEVAPGSSTCYRIFAYGDTPDYDEEEAEPAPVDPFGYCRKYAYGVIPRYPE